MTTAPETSALGRRYTRHLPGTDPTDPNVKILWDSGASLENRQRAADRLVSSLPAFFPSAFARGEAYTYCRGALGRDGDDRVEFLHWLCGMARLQCLAIDGSNGTTEDIGTRLQAELPIVVWARRNHRVDHIEFPSESPEFAVIWIEGEWPDDSPDTDRTRLGVFLLDLTTSEPHRIGGGDRAPRGLLQNILEFMDECGDPSEPECGDLSESEPEPAFDGSGAEVLRRGLKAHLEKLAFFDSLVGSFSEEEEQGPPAKRNRFE